MVIQDEDRWRFLAFLGQTDVNVYADGSVGFIPTKDKFDTFGGKDWKSAVDNGIRKYVRKKLFEMHRSEAV